MIDNSAYPGCPLVTSLRQGACVILPRTTALRVKVDLARAGLFARAGVPVDGNWLPRPFEAPAAG